MCIGKIGKNFLTAQVSVYMLARVVVNRAEWSLAWDTALPACHTPSTRHSCVTIHCPHRLVTYKPQGSKVMLDIMSADVECLDPGEYLNDKIIDFYLKWGESLYMYVCM